MRPDRNLERPRGGEEIQRQRRSVAGRRVPDIEAMRRWLVCDAVRPDGAVVSWVNPAHPGYPYPEAAGLLLSTICGMSGGMTDIATADRIAGWLCQAIRDNGGFGRNGTTYLFDSAVVLAGLVRYREAGGRIGGEAFVHRLGSFVHDSIASGAAVAPRSAEGDGRWSTQFGAHLVKCLHGLQLYACMFGGPLPAHLVTALIDRSGHQPSPLYVHPFCYEQEGHLVVQHYGLASLLEPIDGALEWLAALQQPDGGILAFANGMDGFGEARSDSTAQAVRLWLLRDGARFGAAIERALAFLAACQAPEGGIRYAPTSDDVCSWATMFTLQAVEWFIGRPNFEELL
ncbi:hypothetical protein L6Q96_16785 [Candidatus Binatia bacterium]|nr:hypothetical protein [Candidatus Binatia bacterium]